MNSSIVLGYVLYKALETILRHLFRANASYNSRMQGFFLQPKTSSMHQMIQDGGREVFTLVIRGVFPISPGLHTSQQSYLGS